MALDLELIPADPDLKQPCVTKVLYQHVFETYQLASF